MKKYILISISSIAFFVLSVFSYLYFFQLLPIQREQGTIVSKVTIVVDGFQNCLFVGELDNCTSYADESLAKDFSSSSFQKFRNTFTGKLGKRMSGEVDPKSLNFTKFAGIHGSQVRVNIGYNAIYENDPFVKEYYVFVSNSNGTNYLVQKFHIDSVLFKD